MKPFYAPLLLATFLLLAQGRPAMAQCAGCIADPGCTISPPFPTLCPLAPPDATAGEYYETDITFWLPATFTDPGTGFTVSFEQMTINGVSGLPFGLSLEANSASGIYYPQQNEFGCARICGTPLGAGEFEVTISIIASVVFSGISIDAPQQFAITLVVLPGSGGNNSFTFSPSAACANNAFSFQALIDASPQPTSWDWDLGNGVMSTLATPPAQAYVEPGEYTVTLQTTISGYVLTAVSLSAVNNSWCGDIEEPFCNCGTPFIGTCPDLFFVLENSNGPVYSSSTNNDVTSASWSGLNVLLDNPPYSITFWDEDVISSNDALGTYAIVLAPSGSYAFNVAGGTSGNLAIDLQLLQQFNDTDMVTVFPLPQVELVQNGEQLCATNPTLSSYSWLLDGEPVVGASAVCITPSGPGLWTVVGTNGFGCSDTSNVFVLCPVMSITRTGNTLSAPGGYGAYSWTYNGEPITGSDNTVETLGDGLYTVTVETGNGCTVSAEFLLNTVGLADPHVNKPTLVVFPNPGQGEFTVMAQGLSGPLVFLVLYDISGRQVHVEQANTIGGRLTVALMPGVPSGSYLLQVHDGDRIHTRQVTIQ